MDLDQLLAPGNNSAIPATPLVAYSGKVSRLDGQGNGFVTVPALSLDYNHGPVKVSSGGVCPSVGTPVLVVFDEDRSPWISGEPTDLTTVDSRLDALEAIDADTRLDTLEGRIKTGAGVATWPGSSPFVVLTVPHEMPAPPSVVFAGDSGGGTLGEIPRWSAGSITDTTFTVAAQASSSPAAGITRTFYWTAIG